MTSRVHNLACRVSSDMTSLQKLQVWCCTADLPAAHKQVSLNNRTLPHLRPSRQAVRSEPYTTRTLILRSDKQHGHMGHFYEHMSSNTFCAACVAVRSRSKVRSSASMLTGAISGYVTLIKSMPCRKFHRAMLQAVDKTLGVSFCKYDQLSTLLCISFEAIKGQPRVCILQSTIS